MVPLLLERFALLSALSVLILAVFWPHVRPKLSPLLDRFLLRPLSSLLGLRRSSAAVGHDIVQKQHPKFSGGPLRRTTSEKQSLRSAYSSLEGFSQSPLGNDPASFLAVGRSGSPSVRAGGHHLAGTLPPSQVNQSSSSMSLTVFTATIIALIIYTMMKMLSARFGGRHQRAATCRSSASSSGRGSTELRDLKLDKRKWSRLSRDERARQLMLLHGGKNVSSAIRFLVGELAKQKRLLFENLPENFTGCSCSCHAHAYEEEHSFEPAAEGSESSGREETTHEHLNEQPDHYRQQQQQPFTLDTPGLAPSSARLEATGS